MGRILVFLLVSLVMIPSARANFLDFDGSDDNVNLGDLDSLDGVANFTIEAWVRRTGLGLFPGIFGKSATNATNTVQVGIPSDNGSSFVYCDPCDEDDIFVRVSLAQDSGAGTQGSVLPLDTWVHVAVIFDGSGATNADRLKLYVDGVPRTLFFWGPSIPSLTPDTEVNAYIGRTNDTGCANCIWVGQMDEVRIWSISRSQTDIQSTMNTLLTGSEPGLIAYYPFDQGVCGGNNPTEISLIDQSPNGNDGTLDGFALTGCTSNWVCAGSTCDLPCGPPEASTSLPSISFGGLALLGGLVFAVAVGGLAVGRRRRAG
jgi:hypothetical protein